jgi:hypothetical protein
VDRWKRPYDPDEHHARIICADPVAVAYDQLETWIREQNFKCPITTEDAVDCLWSQEFATGMAKYEIMRNEKIFPEALPDHLYKQIVKGLFGKE